MSSRERIIGRIRTKLGRGADTPAPRPQDVREGAAVRHPGSLPVVDGDLLAQFREKSESLSSTVDWVPAWPEIPLAVARYLRAGALSTAVVGWPLLSAHGWAAAGIEFHARGAIDSDRVGVTGCFCAIAETGTLMLLSGPASPASVSLLPETHIGLVAASRIVATMDEAWTLARSELGELPRAVNFISGPSRTGDIEQTIVLGAHGPYRVHVIVAADA